MTATFVKICVENNPTSSGGGFACTAITEVELKKATGTFATNSSAALESLTVNGTAVTEADLASGVYYEGEETATVEAVAKDNAAVTVLPAFNNKIKVIIESEDHMTQSEFLIRLGEEAPVDPSDDSKDIPTSGMTVISSNQYLPGTTVEGPDDYALDGDTSHTGIQTGQEAKHGLQARKTVG